MYNNEIVNQMRNLLEGEFRKQYDTSCEDSYLRWNSEFKQRFENIVEDLDELDKLL